MKSYPRSEHKTCYARSDNNEPSWDFDLKLNHRWYKNRFEGLNRVEIHNPSTVTILFGNRSISNTHSRNILAQQNGVDFTNLEHVLPVTRNDFGSWDKTKPKFETVLPLSTPQSCAQAGSVPNPNLSQFWCFQKLFSVKFQNWKVATTQKSRGVLCRVLFTKSGVQVLIHHCLLFVPQKHFIPYFGKKKRDSESNNTGQSHSVVAKHPVRPDLSHDPNLFFLERKSKKWNIANLRKEIGCGLAQQQPHEVAVPSLTFPSTRTTKEWNYSSWFMFVCFRKSKTVRTTKTEPTSTFGTQTKTSDSHTPAGYGPVLFKQSVC